MSRSRKKTSKRGITSADSEKQDKRDANRKYRRIVKQQVNRGEEELPEVREVSDVWGFSKDGKVYDPDMREKDKRK
ncbi:hypothetical protein QQ020_20235 [Fulvivirgaceae bacterium BMA12]|uniref:Uncharacterized protein n=1 Tax=Agaribacillus aureus TaxID=3051825 RepID=A0ABT8L9I6_9BACT|nr:hypothetical protein [Fulvivirgaceae bacterium BMA12]